MQMEEQKQKRRERAHLEAFRRACPDFPQGPIDHIDERKEKGPDFVVRASDRVVGIEHTEFHCDDPGKDGSELKTQESLQERIVATAVRLYESRRLPSVDVRVCWNPSAKLSERSVQELPKQMADLVAQHLPGDNEPPVRIKHPKRGWRSLPPQISGLRIAPLGEPWENTWVSTPIGPFPKVGAEDLAPVITKKESHLQAYRTKCGEIWLLIVADGRAASSFGQLSPAVVDCEFETCFDRLFFFRYFDGDYVELRRKSG